MGARLSRIVHHGSHLEIGQHTIFSSCLDSSNAANGSPTPHPILPSFLQMDSRPYEVEPGLFIGSFLAGGRNPSAPHAQKGPRFISEGFPGPMTVTCATDLTAIWCTFHSPARWS
jgi:hypothetical protein